MTRVALGPFESLFLVRQYEPSGVSPESESLAKMRSMIGGHLIQNLFLGADRMDVANELASVFEDCSQTNWDAYGALPLSQEAFQETLSFLRSMPLDLARPEVVPEPDGDIALEWKGTGGRTFIVSFDGTSAATFAGLLGGGNKIHGTSRFIGSMPQNIQDILLQHFSKSKSKAGTT